MADKTEVAVSVTPGNKQKAWKLPDIWNLDDFDNTGKDTFETIDAAEESTKENVETIPEYNNENIDKSKVLPKEAFQKFADKEWNPTYQNYDDTLKKKRIKRGGFVQNQKDFEIEANDNNRNTESALQKFHRLQFEVKVFLEELNSKKNEKLKENEQEVEPSHLAEELVLLQSQLANVLTEQSLKSVLSPKYELDAQKTLQDGVTKKLLTEITKFGAQESDSQQKSDGKGVITYELYYNSEQKRQLQAAKIGDLETRISELENVLGAASTTTISNVGVVPSVEQLREKVTLLSSPSELDALHRRIKAIQIDLDATLDKNKSSQPQLYEQKINDLFEIMSKWDVIAQQLPTIVSRLQSLKKLHEEAATVSTTVAQMDEQQTEMKKLLKNNEELVKQLDTNWASNLKTIQNNFSIVEKRMGELAKKLEELGMETF